MDVSPRKRQWAWWWPRCNQCGRWLKTSEWGDIEDARWACDAHKETR